MNTPVKFNDFDGVPTSVARWADARAELCNLLSRFCANEKLSLRRALPAFVERYNGKSLIEYEPSLQTRELQKALSVPTLQRWQRAYKRGGVSALIPKYGKRRGTGVIETTLGMVDFVESMIGNAPHIAGTRIKDGLGARYGDAIGDCASPSTRTTQRFVANWKEQNRSLYERIANPDKWKSTRSVALGRLDADVTQVNQRWRMDGTPSDVQTLIKVIEIEAVDRRLRLNCSIDVFSRYPTVSVSPTASGEATRAHLRKAFSRQGIPAEILHDWGAEFENNSTRRAMARLCISWLKLSRPYSGNLNGTIEAFQKTLTHNFLEQLPGYTGHNIIEAQAIRSQHSFQQRGGERRNMVRLYKVKLLSTELEPLIDEWIDNWYVHQPHSGLLGAKPIDIFREADARGLISRADERVLDLLLGADGIAIVGREGIRFDNAAFWDNALIPYEGQEVQFIQTQDAGLLVVLESNERPKFICVAVCPERGGTDRQVVALMAKQAEKLWMSEQLDRVRELKRQQKPQQVWREVLDNAKVRAMVTSTAVAGNVKALPYRTAATEAAQKAFQALDAARSGIPDAKVTTILHHKRDQARDGDGDNENAGEERKSESELRFEEYERLIAIPVERRTETQNIKIRVYENSDAYRARKRLGLVA